MVSVGENYAGQFQRRLECMSRQRVSVGSNLIWGTFQEVHCARVRRQASGHSQLRLPAVFGDLHHQQRTHGLFHADYAVCVPPSPHPLCNKVLGTRLSVRLEEGELGRGNGAAASAATIAPCHVPKATTARASVIKQCTHYYL